MHMYALDAIFASFGVKAIGRLAELLLHVHVSAREEVRTARSRGHTRSWWGGGLQYSNYYAHSHNRKALDGRLELRDRIGDPIMIGRFLDFFPIISDPRFLSVRSGIGRFLCVCALQSTLPKSNSHKSKV